MLFWLKKAATIPFLPLPLTLMLAGVGTVLMFSKKRQKLARCLVALAFTTLLAFSNKGVARLLIAPLESQSVAIPEARTSEDLPSHVRACRTIVVLGGGHGESEGMSRINQLSSSALARLTEAVRLARLLPSAKLVVSGYVGHKTISHAQVLSEAAQSLGISPARIIRFDQTRDTHDEALAIAEQVGQEPFLLVTSAWHMPRSLALCKKIGLHPIAAPSDFMLHKDSDTGWALLAWDIGALERSTKAIHEYLGLLWTKLRGQT
ncbi:MAG: ElyC/SanA/YdcF family protein [Nibricoccus sp.]